MVCHVSKAVLQLFPPYAWLWGVAGSEPVCSLIAFGSVAAPPDSPKLPQSATLTVGNAAASTLSIQFIFWNC